ncbi:MAG: PocR ligand-binding domain-containing protein [Vallitaleaceae bacterium]|nr:PocR ligand-binding domain-containing protein [Vallitaleaceae bacterium]
MSSKWLTQNMETIEKHMHIFHMTTELSCILIDEQGKTISQEGVSAPFCTQFQQLTTEKCPCDGSHLYASKQSETLGEAYVFFCPGGLVKFTMAIVTQNVFRGAIIAGPVQMNVPDLYVVDHLIKSFNLPINNKGALQSYFKMVPMVDHNRVRHLAELLQIMIRDLVGDEKYEFKKKRDFYQEQRILSENIQEIKEQKNPTYPIELERELSDKVRHGDSKGAKAILNDLLGYILFKYKGNRTIVISMMIELLVVMSRAAVEGGARYEEIVASNTKFYEDAYKTTNIDEICVWMVQALEKFTELVFTFEDANVENRNLIRKALLYIHEHYQKEITLEEVADHVKLSETYFSRLFSKEIKRNFTEYVNLIRIGESKKLLLDLSYSLCDIAILTGFSDQSYFSKVFKKHEGLSPGMYRKTHQG